MKYLNFIVISVITCFASINSQADEVNGQQLFRPEFVHAYDDRPDLNETYKVIQFLKERALPGIDMWEGELPPHFENSGYGSAMALDFLARYINECSNLTDEEIALCIKGFEPYYKIQASTFVARDYAFEQVACSEESEKAKYSKFQTIANYHNLTLYPVTDSLKKKAMKAGRVKLKKMIEDLPPSTYVIRALDPATADRQEDGHTMILIKQKNFSIFYDSNDGASLINKNSGRQIFKIGEYAEDFLIELPFSEFRLYKASCGKEGCINLYE